MALYIRPDGTSKTVKPQDIRKGFTLRELYIILECQGIERIPVIHRRGTNMIMDEDGKQAGKPVNEKATNLRAEFYKIPVEKLTKSGDHIVGSVLICTDKEFK